MMRVHPQFSKKPRAAAGPLCHVMRALSPPFKYALMQRPAQRLAGRISLGVALRGKL
ncbi:hypothetical protein RPE78_04870 [Thioclava litoralis]|uniref:Uncharacterized protein n=1 Tax=Thioclava litoralis TaxID=3076557 RepID=A0ABZ1E3G0_9RHOB|nr:hypothetical protein RPE78_04870 [Thioclava sp. FTW29]